MAGLPKFVVLRPSSSHKCLSLAKDVANAPTGFMNCNIEQAASPRAKFEVEMAKTGNGLVHIRSCYNNKYWAPNLTWSFSLLILASGDKPDENQSHFSCTLFEPRFALGQTQVRFFHVKSKSFAYLWKSGPRESGTALESGLFLDISSEGKGDIFQVIDWETLVILPPRVAFKSFEHGSYLCSRWIEGHPYQRFESNLDAGDPLVAKELYVNADGNLRIKDGHYGKFWRRSPNWIWADGAHDNHSNDTVFRPVRVGDNVIALRNLGNNNFCGGLTTEGKTNCLNAAYPNISKQSKLVVEELVISRTIYDINFRLSDSRIYHEQVIEMGTAVAVNDSPNSDSTISLKFSEKDSRTHSWSGSVSLKLGAKTTLQVNCIPLIVEGKIEVWAEATTAYQWGKTTTVEHIREANFTVVVPPLTKMKVSLVASRASYDVPFSYTQRDVLPDGRTVTRIMDDGLYTGINAYKFDYQNQAYYGGQAPAVSSPALAVSSPAPAVSSPAPAVSSSAPAVSSSAPAVSSPAPAVSSPWRLSRAVYVSIFVILLFSVLLPVLELM